MSRFEIRGAAFDDSTDWVAWLRDVVRSPWRHAELRDDLEASAAVSELASRLPDAHAARLADAAIETLASGTDEERLIARRIPLRTASNARARLSRLVEQHGDALGAAKALAPVLQALAELGPVDGAVRDLLVRELDAGRGGRATAIGLLARHATSWLVANIRRLGADPGELRAVFISTPEDRRHDLLEALAAAGTDRVDALWRGITDPAVLAPVTRTQFSAVLRAHPAFAARAPE
jgi:hypothetical protein